jgi:hypothetical protein
VIIINNLLELKGTHYLATFKDHLLDNTLLELLHRYYTIEDWKERSAKFYDYYKNYLSFFCKPIFRNLYVSELLQDNGQNKAELYYNKKYKRGNKENKDNNIKNYKIIKSIFTESIKGDIEKFKNDSIKKKSMNISRAEESRPSSIVISYDSNNDSKMNINDENTIMNLIQMIPNSKNNSKTNIHKININDNYVKSYINSKQDFNINEHLNANPNHAKNQKMNLFSIKTIKINNNNKDDNNIKGPLTTRIKNNSKIKLRNIQINNLFPISFKRSFNSKNKDFQTKNKTIENWRNNNVDIKVMNYNNKKNIKISKGFLYLNSNKNINNNKQVNYLLSLANTKTNKNLKINTQLLSMIKSPNRNNEKSHKKLLRKNLSNILKSIKNTISRKNHNNFSCLSNKTVIILI